MLDRESEATRADDVAALGIAQPRHQRHGIDLAGRPGERTRRRSIEDRHESRPVGGEEHAEDVQRTLDHLPLRGDLGQGAEKVERGGMVGRPAVRQAHRGERLGALRFETPRPDQASDVQANVVETHGDDLGRQPDERGELPQPVGALLRDPGVEQHDASHRFAEDRRRACPVDTQDLQTGAPVCEPPGRDEIRPCGEVVVDERGGGHDVEALPQVTNAAHPAAISQTRATCAGEDLDRALGARRVAQATQSLDRQQRTTASGGKGDNADRIDATEVVSFEDAAHLGLEVPADRDGDVHDASSHQVKG